MYQKIEDLLIKMMTSQNLATGFVYLTIKNDQTSRNIIIGSSWVKTKLWLLLIHSILVSKVRKRYNKILKTIEI